MQKEKIDRANEILSVIDDDKMSIDTLREFEGERIILFDRSLYGISCFDRPKEIIFTRSEIGKIIRNKKNRIAKLERELEKL